LQTPEKEKKRREKMWISKEGKGGGEKEKDVLRSFPPGPSSCQEGGGKIGTE